ncbi:hypothetical protein ALP50_200238 [Pseudomonas syringae pv. spinaceae]|nr:hypothetical protein ALP50_200238 [Pseudomonas syringae pv. spinaceae]
MESAIDKHLKCPRTLSRRVHDDYQPPFPMFVGRADESVQQVVMAYLGVQFREEQRTAALETMRHIVSSFALANGPGNHDMTYHLDNQGYGNFIVVGYWRDPVAYCQWLRSPPVADWWSDDARLNEGLGYFREVIAPRAEQFETLYAFKEDLPGIGAVMDGIRGEIEEHGYWGSARDRFAVSQTDWMQPTSELQVLSGDPAKGGRVVVRGAWSRQSDADPLRTRLGRSWRGRTRAVFQRDAAATAGRHGLPARRGASTGLLQQPLRPQHRPRRQFARHRL